MLLSCDDKHNIKVCEPHHPVASLNRGNQVIGCEVIPILALVREFNTAKVNHSVLPLS